MIPIISNCIMDFSSMLFILYIKILNHFFKMTIFCGEKPPPIHCLIQRKYKMEKNDGLNVYSLVR